MGPPGKLPSGVIQIGFTTENCTVSRVGSLRYNSPQHSLEFCNGNEWVEIISNGKGYTKMNPGLHCLDILKTGMQKTLRSFCNDTGRQASLSGDYDFIDRNPWATGIDLLKGKRKTEKIGI